MELNTKNMILGLLVAEHKTYTSVKHFQNMLIFVYNELVKRNLIDKYEILFDTSFFSIEKTVLCNNQILDIDEDIIYFCGKVDDLAKLSVSNTEIEDIIKKFVNN